MKSTTRFGSPSISLNLRVLLERTKRVLWLALAAGIVAHFLAARWRGVRQEARSARPLTTQFVKRQPRLTKPLELRKRPQPKARRIQREMLTVQARVNRQQVSSSTRPVAVVRSLARAQASTGRPAAFTVAQMEPDLIAQAIGSAKEAKNAVDMSLEMMDVSALDTGQYQAMVIQDPQDRRNIQGFFHFAYAYSVTMRSFESHGDTWRPIRGIRHLIRAVSKYTNIQCDLVDGYTYDSRKLFLTPLVPAVTRWPFKLTEGEATNLGQCLMLGGFLFVDPTYYTGGDIKRPAMASSYGMVQDALATQRFERGAEYDFEKLPNDHPLYHCFFDFDGPPPAGDCVPRAGQHIMYEYLEGITIYNQLRVILSKKWFFNAWGDWGLTNPYDYARYDPERALQFGVNLIVFVLTQEGSITRQVMDSASH